MKNTVYNGCMTCGHELCAKKVSLFSKLDPDQLQAVIALIERKRYKKGATILRLGDAFDRLFIVNHGSLKACTYGEDGKEHILYILGDGDSLGELSLLKLEAAPYDLIALKESYLCTIPKSSFDAFVKANSEITLAILESAHERIRSLEKLVGAIASNDADTRLKFLIQNLMTRSGTPVEGGILITEHLTREDMANFVGVTRETISRKLSQLTAEGALKLVDGKKLMVLNPERFTTV